MLQRYVEEIDLHGEISLVFFNGLVSHAVEKRSALHPASVTNPEMHEAVVTAEAADSVAWKWGEEIRRVLHGYVRSRLGHDEQFLFNRVDLVPDGKGSFLVMEVSLVDADLYLGATPGRARQLRRRDLRSRPLVTHATAVRVVLEFSISDG